MLHHVTLVTVVLALILIVPRRALAWSNKEHIQLTRIAAARLIADPETTDAMKRWLSEATPGLSDMDGERAYFRRQRVGMYPRGVDGVLFWAAVPDLDALTSQREKKVEPFGVNE